MEFNGLVYWRRAPQLLGHITFYELKKTTLKITELKKMHFIKVNELKLTQVELF